MARYETASVIINDVASEVGLTASSDPFASLDPAFITLGSLLTSVGRELLGMYPWQKMKSTFTQTTHSVDSGKYDLPADYGYFLENTGWVVTTRFPLSGPFTPEDYSMIVGSANASAMIYLGFRETEGQIWVLPVPPPENYTFTIEYISLYWAKSAAGAVRDKDRITANDDIVYFPPILVVKMLKLRYLEAKGFDTTAVLDQFNAALESWMPKDKVAMTLSMAGRRVIHYLDGDNIPEMNWG